MSNFNIDSITVFKECNERLRKNLKKNYEYKFVDVLEDDFFKPNISVHAIVGKNGSGKSTLLEIMFRLINNLSFVLLTDIPRDASDNLCYVFGLYAEMKWHCNGARGVLSCKDNKVIFFCGEAMIELDVDERALMRTHMDTYDFSHEYAEVKKMAENFFYTLVVNYSMQSYVAQDYIGEECKSKNSNRHVSWSVKDVWINTLFHKNDGYMCPINLNPYRHQGTLDMNKEMGLTRNRVASLLEYFGQSGIQLIEGYELDEIKYVYNPYKVNGYFDNNELLRKYDAVRKPNGEEERTKREERKDQNHDKLQWLLTLFDLALASQKENVTKAVLDVFGIDTSKKTESYRVGMLYLVCKVLNIGHVYPTYILLTKAKKEYSTWDVLEPECAPEVIITVKELAEKIKGEDSHVTLKVKRMVNYLKFYGRYNQYIEYGAVIDYDDSGFNSVNYRKAFYGEWASDEIPKIKLSLKELELMTPPSIYQQYVFLRKTEQNESENNKIELSWMSSGERQFVFSTSAIVYHLTNLLSVKDGNPKYHCFNIVVDEVEICFHPEYQRTFLKKLLNLIDRMGFNKDGNMVNVMLTTHSPFILSDIPAEHILYMTGDDEKVPEGRTFGANIYDLLNNQFFMDDTIGALAADKIRSIIELYHQDRNKDRKKYFCEKYQSIVALCGRIGDDYLRRTLENIVAEMASEYGMEESLSNEEAMRQIQAYRNAIKEIERKMKWK